MARRPPVPESPVPESETSRLIELVRSTVPPMHPAGFPFVVAGLAVAAAGRNHRPIRTAGLIAAGAAAVFFRHPPRVPPAREGVVVAPADGQISVVDTAIPPAELGLPDRPLPRVSIFLSLFDPHVQRVPVGGEAVAVCYRPGAFFSADRPRSSEDNERNSVLIRTSSGSQVAVVQIAGLLARRIECEIRAGDRLSIGDTYGLIRFGSRVDTYLPEQATVLVLPGQRAVSAETVLAELP